MDAKSTIISFVRSLPVTDRPFRIKRDLWNDILRYWPRYYLQGDSPFDLDEKYLDQQTKMYRAGRYIPVNGLKISFDVENDDEAPRKWWDTHLPECETVYHGCSPLCPRRVHDLEVEIDTDDRIMAEWARVLDAIPPCPAHGDRCVPHALEWLTKVKALGSVIFGEVEHGKQRPNG